MACRYRAGGCVGFGCCRAGVLVVGVVMQPSPVKTPLERAEDFDVAAKIAYDKHDYVFAQELAQHAHHLRMEYEREQHGQLPKD